MNVLRCLTLLLLMLPILAQGQNNRLDEALINRLNESADSELVPILILLKDAVDIEALKADFQLNNVSVDERPRLVMGALKAKASKTQPAILEVLEKSGYTYLSIQQFWISNSMALLAEPDLIRYLAESEGVARIGLNTPQFSLIEPEKNDLAAAKSLNGIEPGLLAIGAPEMWALGYTGHGRMALTFDTGVWPDHPAISSRFLPNLMPLGQTWYAYDSDEPIDKSSSHGTHVSGIMLGLDAANNDTIGVAPRAYFIATDPIVSNLADVKPLSDLMFAYQWALNPDDDESTLDDVPDVINNSWGRSNDVDDMEWIACPEFVIPVLNAVLAAGIANVFSAGNEGPDPMTIGVPHNINTGLVNSFTVAAVNGNVAGPNYPVASFSSRGPSLCGGEGSLLIKPEVSAPGVNVRSAVNHDEYAIYSGTSMAAPHTSGAILLLKEAFPYMTGEELMLALYYSAIDLGTEGEDNTYGMGIINVKAAYDYLAVDNEPIPPALFISDLHLASIDFPDSEVLCTNGSNTVEPVVTIANLGMNAIIGIDLHYAINGGAEVIYSAPNQILDIGQSVQLTLPGIALSSETKQELHIYLDPVDNEYDLFNNHMTTRWKTLPTTTLTSSSVFEEDFSDGINPDLWTVLNPDNSITWDTISVIQSDGETGSAAWMHYPEYTLIASQKDDLMSPMFYCQCVDQESDSLYVEFDLFYRARSANTFTKDTLAIFIEQQCSLADASRVEIFRQGGDELVTTPDNLSNAYPENAGQWSHVSLAQALDPTAESHFYITFQGINRRGNNLLIDNINISLSAILGIEKSEIPFISIYPNPSTGSVYLMDNGSENPIARIYDISGRLVKGQSKWMNGTTLDLSNLDAGVYVVQLTYDNVSSISRKIVLR